MEKNELQINNNISLEKSNTQTVNFEETVSGRYFCIEVMNAQDANDNAASLAEMELIGEDGNAVSALNW